MKSYGFKTNFLSQFQGYRKVCFKTAAMRKCQFFLEATGALIKE
jgi:hypothetical protein